MEDGLTGLRPDVNDDAVIVEARDLGCLRDELEHALRLARVESADLAERCHVPLGQDEDVHRGLRGDVLNGEEAFAAEHDLGLDLSAHDPAEDAVAVRAHAARIPSAVTSRPRTRTSAPTRPSTSHGE